MIGNKQCVRCKDSHLIQTDYFERLEVRLGPFSGVALELSLCPQCGYTELGVASKEDLRKVKDKFNLKD